MSPNKIRHRHSDFDPLRPVRYRGCGREWLQGYRGGRPVQEMVIEEDGVESVLFEEKGSMDERVELLAEADVNSTSEA